MLDTLGLLAAALLAGTVDAIVGGGGLILVPALFSAFPQAPPATLFGTNKAAAIWGTAWAAGQYARRVTLRPSLLLPAGLATAAGAWLGAWTVSGVDGSGLRKALPLLLIGLLAYTLARKELGQAHAPLAAPRGEAVRGAAIGLGVGFYDGFFGPGTGSFFIFLIVRLLGHDFLHASAHAKLLNTVANAAALSLFAATGTIWWGWALALAAANVLGSLLGTWLALHRGAGFVRQVFLLVVGALILKTGWDGWLR